MTMLVLVATFTSTSVPPITTSMKPALVHRKSIVLLVVASSATLGTKTTRLVAIALDTPLSQTASRASF